MEVRSALGVDPEYRRLAKALSRAQRGHGYNASVLQHFAYATALTVGTTFIHFACTVAVIRGVRWLEEHPRPNRGAPRGAALIAALILVMSLAAVLESALWAGFYVWVGALPAFEPALYFSIVTLTTLGYGDITLAAEWRMLAAFEAANGVILFGWTTALIVSVATRVIHLNRPGGEGR
jgi:hypothetical protein